MWRTSSIIPCKKDNLSVYNIRKVCFASLLSFFKKQDRGPTRFEIARHILSVGLPRSEGAVVNIVSIFTIKTVVNHIVRQRTTRPKPKGKALKAVEKKEIRGSQSRTENIIAQFCTFVKPPK